MSSTKKTLAIPSTTRRGHIAAYLRSEILAGNLAAGTRISEAILATHLGVSRGPIREAMRVLEEEGLLTTRPYVGTFVAVVDETALIEAYELRRPLETYSFKLIWPNRTREFRETLTRRHQQLINASRGFDRAAEVAAELEFHSTPYEFCGNSLMYGFWQQLAQRIQLGLHVCRLSRQGCSQTANGHRDYLRYALGDDLDAMVRIVDQHIDLGIESVRSYWRSKKDAVADEGGEQAVPDGGSAGVGLGEK